MSAPLLARGDRAASAARMPGWLSACIVAGTFVALAWLERRRPLRRTVEPGLRRVGRNLAIATIGSVAIQLAETPVVTRAAGVVERHHWGLVKGAGLPL